MPSGRGGAGVDGLALPVEADDMVGAGEDDPLDAVLARRLVEVVGADDVGLQDRLERPLHRIAAEMDDRVDVRHHRFHRGRIGEVRLEHFLAIGGGAEIGDVRQRRTSQFSLRLRAAPCRGRRRRRSGAVPVQLRDGFLLPSFRQPGEAEGGDQGLRRSSRRRDACLTRLPRWTSAPGLLHSTQSSDV